MNLRRIPYPMPKRVKRAPMGITKPKQRIWPRHRRWIKSHGCCVPGCQATEIEFAHIRNAANSGIALKSHDCFGVGLCFNHHREQHQVGQGTFEDRHGIDLDAIAAEFTRTSPDMRMRVALLAETILEPIPVYRAVERRQ